MPQKAKVTLPKGTKVPDHLALIPDGNRRWARARGLYTLEGHKAGFNRAVELARVARDWGINTVTLWGFSTENWDRTKKEISYLMRLYEKLVEDHLKEAREKEVKITHLGRKDRLPTRLVKKIVHAEEVTKDNRKYWMNIAIDYGGHDEIIRAVQAMMKDGVTAGEVDKKLFENYLDTKNQPYPYVDLLIRSSGEQRTSGLMPWQAYYAELYWSDVHLPDFDVYKLKNAILDYSCRRRRFGGNDVLGHLKFEPEVSAKLELAWWRLQNIPQGERLRDYSIRHIREQYGVSRKLAKEASKYMLEAVFQRQAKKWEKAKRSLKKFYRLIRDELKLAFEPEIIASLEVKFWQGIKNQKRVAAASEVEDVARQFYAETYRISLLQATKVAHLRVMAAIERNLAEAGLGDQHWERAGDYLEKFYKALKDRVA